MKVHEQAFYVLTRKDFYLSLILLRAVQVWVQQLCFLALNFVPARLSALIESIVRPNICGEFNA